MTIKGKLILLRHGQTTYNEEQRMAGQRDVPLTPLGIAQAKAAGDIVSVFHFDKIYTSTLSRAFNTAALALGARGGNEHLKKPDGSFLIEQRPEIMECDAGDFTGILMSDPAVKGFVRKYGASLPGGESDKQLISRVQKFYDTEIMPRITRGETVLVVSHAGVMHALDFVMGLEKIGPEGLWSTKTKLPNTAAFAAEYEDGRLKSHYPLGLQSPPVPPKNIAGKNAFNSW